jgi:hypothetical protein
VQGWDEGWGREAVELRLEELGVVRRERVLRLRAGGMCVEEEDEATDCSSSLLEADEKLEGLGDRGYLRREMGCERVRLNSGRLGLRGVVGWPWIWSKQSSQTRESWTGDVGES